jgi:N-acetylglucosaminyl-diphospho-decaprenol L-rhamnosyltransferase
LPDIDAHATRYAMTQIAPLADAQRQHPQLVIVVLTYGPGHDVSGLLEHLRAKTLRTSHELIVVHNPSRPGERLVSSPAGEVSVLELPSNSGYVGGMNAGIDLAFRRSPAFVLLLTHDVRITAQEVEQLESLLRDRPDLGALGPVLCRSDKTPYSAGVVRYDRVGMRYRLPPLEGMPRPLWSCAAIDGSVMMWRASALEQVGGFDERFFMYFEDVDICARATRLGWGIAVATDLHAISVPGGSHRRSAHAYLRARNGLAYARSYGGAGFLGGLAQCALGLWHATPKPGGSRFSQPEARKAAAAYWRGTLLGVVDYFRGRWGPPPPSILRDSDIAATGQ